MIGGFASGPLHLGRINFRGELRRPIMLPILLGLATAAVFIVGAVIVREIEPLRDLTENVLAFARYGSLPLVALITLMNGIAEEIFFRGALFAAIGVLASGGDLDGDLHPDDRRHRQPDAGLLGGAARGAARACSAGQRRHPRARS